MPQVLINLLKNAVEAAGEFGEVQVRWSRQGDWLRAEIVDNGPGLARTDNLGVPFFTTKPGGTGIGLVLSREIVENHGGSIALENRKNARGCVATLFLPVDSHEHGAIWRRFQASLGDHFQDDGRVVGRVIYLLRRRARFIFFLPMPATGEFDFEHKAEESAD